MKLKNSLLFQYVLIVLSAIVLLPLTFPLVSLSVLLPANFGRVGGGEIYQDGAALEKLWHEEASKLGGASAEEVEGALGRLKAQYPEAGMFWVDGHGGTRLQLRERGSLPDIPAVWTPADALHSLRRA